MPLSYLKGISEVRNELLILKVPKVNFLIHKEQVKFIHQSFLNMSENESKGGSSMWKRIFKKYDHFYKPSFTATRLG